ncbi:MAG: hypothetical protein USCAAHI_02307 [Beijerinckiaceae bacterium]|nr:MAG: hypothetical protein USCAAHI_02307 [Beijerinckiaceae bacterium]
MLLRSSSFLGLSTPNMRKQIMWRVVVDTLKDASARSDVLSTGVRTASFVSNARHLVSRGEFFAGLFILGFANGIFGRIAGAVAREPVWSAISTTFGISVLVWVA